MHKTKVTALFLVSVMCFAALSLTVFAEAVPEEAYVDPRTYWEETPQTDITLSFLLDNLFNSLKNNDTPAQIVPGDVNGDKNITAADARCALRMSVGLEVPNRNSRSFIAADINEDGSITSADARIILRLACGLA